jgi:hypothetical protein
MAGSGAATGAEPGLRADAGQQLTLQARVSRHEADMKQGSRSVPVSHQRLT